jgi:ACS family glucarate transporter-like MFS transporter
MALKTPRPSRVRWQIVALVTLIIALTYLDRLNLSIAGKHIQDEFGFSTQTMGWLLSAFVLGYALFQVPGGWAGDRYGPRGILTFAIIGWSVFTALTGLVPRLPHPAWLGLAWAFALVRFLIGVGEAAALPNINKTVAYWIPADRRGIGNSVFGAGVGVGGTITPVFIAAMTQRWGWRTSFYVCAALGLAVAMLWRLHATNRPEEHPRVNAAELALIRAQNPAQTDGLPVATAPRQPAPWGRILSSGSVWGLILSYFCLTYPAYIFYLWFFLYLVRVRGLTLTQGGWGGSAPFVAIALLSPLGGWLSDRAVCKFGKRRGRRGTVWVGVLLSAILLWTGSHAAHNTLAILLLAVAAGFNGFASTSWWATCTDLTQRFTGSLSGLMNMCGNLGGWVSPILTAYIGTHFGWTQALDFAAVVTLLSGILWVGVNADEELEGKLSIPLRSQN